MWWDEETAYEEYDDEGWTIWHQLLVAQGSWWEIYCSYWAVNGRVRPDHLSPANRSWDAEFELAGSVASMARTLSLFQEGTSTEAAGVTTSGQKLLRDLIRGQSKRSVVRDRIALDLAENCIGRMEGAEHRVARLAGLVHAQPLTFGASRYVRRCTELFIAGFDIEAGIMCGAALEAALKDRCQPHYDPDEAPPSLDALLEIAGREQILEGYERRPNSRGWRARSNSQLWRADRLRRLRNDLVHQDPDWATSSSGISDAFQAIRELSEVLGWLFPLRTFG